MSERPFMQLYVSDFVGDTLTLTTEHIGAYLLLLIALWNADGTLDDDEEVLAVTARLPLDRWRVIWSRLSKYFVVEDGKVTHNRLTKELDKFARKSAARSEAGRRGGKAKALKDKNTSLAIAMPLSQHLPEPYNKGKGASRNVPTEGTVRLDRNANAPLFAACESLTSPVPDFMTAKEFPVSIYRQAVEMLAAKETKH